MSDESIFAEALAIPDTAAREEYLERACAGDSGLRREVEALLAAHAGENPLDRPPEYQVATELTDEGPPPAEVGDTIGPYRLMEQIGEGGFGLVFVAEQHEPVRRKVALKVLKPGMDTRDVVARFEAERQALALMDHPNIAKVLDAGSTPNGRPYFVMELVKGIPINQYCDEQRLSPTERLELFAQVCQAVQHAHQKGIIHRDIKPTNVLVTVIDGKPVPKVIDFGVAKAVGQNLTERTIYTRFAQLVGTPLYMSPEQAQLSGVDVDTRSDIYSLGVLLYELLTGTTPFDSKRFRTAALEEIRRIIREEDPPRPSHRLSSLGETLPSVSANRKTEPARLPGVVRGELDWIVMKCLEKDRDRRYETANGLARDVQRYLTGEAVDACPPTLGYRLRKLYRRNRAAVLTGLSFAVVLFVATGVSTWQAVRATQARNRAIQAENVARIEAEEKINALEREAQARNDASQAASERDQTFTLLSEVLSKFNPYNHPTGEPTIQYVLSQACQDLENKEGIAPVMRAALHRRFGKLFQSLHEGQLAHEQFRKAAEIYEKEKGPDDHNTIYYLKMSAYALSNERRNEQDLEEAAKILSEVHARQVKIKGESSAEARATLAGIMRVRFLQARFADVLDHRRQEMELAQANPETAKNVRVMTLYRKSLADLLSRSAEPDDLAEAKLLLEQVIDYYRDELGEAHPETLQYRARLIDVLLASQTDPKLVKEYIELSERVLQSLPAVEKLPGLTPYDTLALFSLIHEQLPTADNMTKVLIDYSPKTYGERSPMVSRSKIFRSWYLVLAEEYDQAEKILAPIISLEEASDSGSFSGGWDDLIYIKAHWLYGMCLRSRGQLELAQKHIETALRFMEMREKRMEPFVNRFNLNDDQIFLTALIEIYQELGKDDEATTAQVKLDKTQLLLDRMRQEPTSPSSSPSTKIPLIQNN